MGVSFNDPFVELDEIYWYAALANTIFESLKKNEGLIYVDEEFKTHSCYVELHREGHNLCIINSMSIRYMIYSIFSTLKYKAEIWEQKISSDFFLCKKDVP